MPFAYLSGQDSSARRFRNPYTGAEVPYWPAPGSPGAPKPTTAPVPAPSGTSTTEQEAWDTAQAYAPTVQTMIEWISGKWNKEERTAQALARQAEASQGGGILGSVTSQSGGPLGLPWIVWILAGGLGVYALTHK
jgi:hypothetical protein